MESKKNTINKEIIIDVSNQCKSQSVSCKWIRKIIRKTFQMENIMGPGEISISFVDDIAITSLNSQYLGHDRTTDVIAFPGGNSKVNNYKIFGDVIVSLETVEEQSVKYSSNFNWELGFVLVHGVLHLLGYKDDTLSLQKKMWKRQEEILKHCEIPKTAG